MAELFACTHSGISVGNVEEAWNVSIANGARGVQPPSTIKDEVTGKVQARVPQQLSFAWCCLIPPPPSIQHRSTDPLCHYRSCAKWSSTGMLSFALWAAALRLVLKARRYHGRLSGPSLHRLPLVPATYMLCSPLHSFEGRELSVVLQGEECLERRSWARQTVFCAASPLLEAGAVAGTRGKSRGDLARVLFAPSMRHLVLESGGAAGCSSRAASFIPFMHGNTQHWLSLGGPCCATRVPAPREKAFLMQRGFSA